MPVAAAAPAERTLVHYTPKKITEFQNSPPEQLRLFIRFGKPSGLWYAYGDPWRHFVEHGRSGRSKNTLVLRYDFTLPEAAFVSDVASATPDTILELSAANLDAFMERFARPEYMHSRDEMIQRAFEVFIKDGSSSVLDELADSDKSGKFTKYLEELSELIAGEIPDPQDLADEAKYNFPELFAAFAPSRLALNRDYTVNFAWSAFWRDVAAAIGGIEFQEDLFEIQEWRGIWLSWSNRLDVRSGVIFHPAAFRGGVLVDKILRVDPMVTASGGTRKRGHRCRRGHRRRSRRLARKRSRKI